jgi:pyruvate, water dikinase
MLHLDEIDLDDVRRVGAKAVSLALIRRCGLRVPDTIVIDNRWFHSFIEHAGLTAKVELLEQILWTIRWEHLQKVSEEITAAVRSAGLPAAYERTLAETLRNGALDDVPLVCRSSSSFEDSDQGAFPGVFYSTLDVCSREQLKDAIVVCYGSLFEMTTLKYLLSQRPTDASMQMAVIVQRLVDSEVAGVAFSHNPTDPQDTAVIIEAIAGRGDSLVSGRETPCRYRVFDDDRFEMDPAAATVAKSPVLLDRHRVARVANICRQLRLVRGQEVDVEFAFATNENEPYVLQCRPITTTIDASEPIVRRRQLTGRVEHGITCADGFVEGEGFDFRDFRGDVAQLEDRILLVDGVTTDDYDAVFACRGVVNQRHDSQLNHVSIACRELGIPYIAAVANACTELDGRRLALDGGTGSVWVIPDGSPGASERPATGKPAPQPLTSDEVAYLPSLEHDGGAGQVTFRGVDLFLIGLAHETTGRAELEAAILERLDHALGTHPTLTLRLPPLSLSTTELAVLNECIAGMNLTSAELRDWFGQLVMRVQHRERVVLI